MIICLMMVKGKAYSKKTKSIYIFIYLYQLYYTHLYISKSFSTWHIDKLLMIKIITIIKTHGKPSEWKNGFKLMSKNLMSINSNKKLINMIALIKVEFIKPL